MTDITLLHGDCLELMKSLPAGSVDAVITDPPYGIDLQAHDLTGAFRRATRVISGDNSQEQGQKALAILEGLPCVVFANPMKPWPGKWRQHLVWNKGGALGGGGDIGTTWKFTWELIQIRGTGELSGRRDSAVLNFPALPSLFEIHPAAKPVALMKYLILKTTKPGDTILDPFMGSGTTGVACVKTGRNFIGMEIDAGYFAIAQRRIAEAQMQPALFTEAA